eukprot:1379495-Amorphochlora_amoeboformis.AAC.1
MSRLTLCYLPKTSGDIGGVVVGGREQILSLSHWWFKVAPSATSDLGVIILLLGLIHTNSRYILVRLLQ